MIKNGENIAENYGPLYSQHGKQERQDNLKYLYWFDCNCEACEQNWPVFEDMNTNEIRFKYVFKLWFSFMLTSLKIVFCFVLYFDN